MNELFFCLMMTLISMNALKEVSKYSCKFENK